jgi:2-C-methyl-D-erythritol 4-phosphate cytidylyltransferase
VLGGSTRAESVRRGLDVLDDDIDVVVVHDAARPAASPQLFTRVLEALHGDVDGVVPGVAVSDTLKRVARRASAESVVLETIPRDNVVAVQTPQAFRLSTLRRAHEGAPDATDDAALLEAIGATVVVVEGEPDNVKITRPRDLAEMRARRWS